ncbi:hypothetical protein [Verrucomicrobium spinosum]|uniref:hypothetical protein n=1 Tax=Verrucomicrobium spinosum TaxID=2736 RepID=UPI0012E232E4|nr:hypothetical protein [Verrucomicrobium spinosum]
MADLATPGYLGAFKVAMAGAAAVRVGLGLIENIVPKLRRVPLDGRDSKGRRVSVPVLKVEDGPNKDLQSWVCLKVTVDKLGVIDAKAEIPVDVVHLNDLTGKFANGFSVDQDGVGYLPIALLLWRDQRRLFKVVQNVYFNQRHSFAPPEKDGGKGWHVFSPVA